MAGRCKKRIVSLTLYRPHFDFNAKAWSDLYHNLTRLKVIVLINGKNIPAAFLCRYVEQGSIILDAG